MRFAIDAAVAAFAAVTPDPRSIVADRVMTLTRTSTWTLVASVPIGFRTFHPQGMVKIGDTVMVTVTVTELMPERSRARLSCVCAVAGEVVLDGEALVKVPKETGKGRPVMRL